MNFKLLADSFAALRGQFSPSNLGSQLFMERNEIETPDNFLIWFHERFHYLQVIFTPYGHLKWASCRTSTADIFECWANLSATLNQPKKMPIREYLKDDTKDSVKLAYNIWIHDFPNDIYKIVEQGTTTYGNFGIFNKLSYSSCCPTVIISEKEYRMRGIDVLESFAKFEEAMLGELITDKNLDEIINPDKLNPEYYSALYYFIESLGPERLIEFPLVCELSLMTSHIPSPSSIIDFKHNAPNWRFVSIVDKIKDLKDLPTINYYDNKSFYEYSNAVLHACQYDTIDKAWKSAEEYVKAQDLTMAEEMRTAIEYKKKHPWMLSYPMCNLAEFSSNEFNHFKPYFTIMEDGVSYNCENIRSEELILENHLQALALQICGYNSKFCRDSFKLMCGYTYMGLNSCRHYLNGECNGYIDSNTELPPLVLDENSNIKNGCDFECFLKINNIDVKDISIGIMRTITYDDIMNAAKKHFTAQ